MKRLPGGRPPRLRPVPLVAVAAVLIYWLWPGAEPEVVAAVARDAAPGTPMGSAPAPVRPFAFAQRLVKEASQNVFASHSWYVPPPAPPRETPRPAQPTAPPLPYEYLGSYARAGERPVYFLVKGDRVFDVHVGDVLENLYSVDAVSNGQLELTYLPLKFRQVLSVGSPQ